MITITGQEGNLIVAELGGRVRHEDYTEVLYPAIEATLNAYDDVRICAVVNEDFAGYELTAMLDDAVMGVKHFAAWDKIALVGGPGWIRQGAQLMQVFMPGRVRLFDDEMVALAWLKEDEPAEA